MTKFLAILVLLVCSTVSFGQATATATATAGGRTPLYVPDCVPATQMVPLAVDPCATLQAVPAVRTVPIRVRTVRVPVQTVQTVPCAPVAVQSVPVQTVAPPIAVQTVPVPVVQTVPTPVVQTVPTAVPCAPMVQAVPVCTERLSLLANHPVRSMAQATGGFFARLIERVREHHLLPHKTVARSRAVTRER